MAKCIIAGIGHRPNKLGNDYRLTGELTKKISQAVFNIFNIERPTEIISGMAQGFDQILAICAIKSNIPFIAAVPFEGQEFNWPEESQRLYKKILKRANKVEVICPPGYSAYKMQERNKWMCVEADKILACWDGTSGGTENCLIYAQKIGKPIIRINPRELYD